MTWLATSAWPYILELLSAKLGPGTYEADNEATTFAHRAPEADFGRGGARFSYDLAEEIANGGKAGMRSVDLDGDRVWLDLQRAGPGRCCSCSPRHWMPFDLRVISARSYSPPRYPGPHPCNRPPRAWPHVPSSAQYLPGPIRGRWRRLGQTLTLGALWTPSARNAQWRWTPTGTRCTTWRRASSFCARYGLTDIARRVIGCKFT